MLTGECECHCLLHEALLPLPFLKTLNFGSAKIEGIGHLEPRQNKLLGVYAFLVLGLLGEQVER